MRLETLLRLVSQTVDFPEVRINIVDEDTQHTVSLFGADDPGTTPRSHAFCDTVVRTGEPVLVEDAANDPRFSHYPTVTDGSLGSYLGVPLVGREALIIGAVCVIDPESRTIEPDQVRRLTEFARVVEDQLDLFRRLREQRLDNGVSTADIARAVTDGEIVPWYQPVVNLATGDIVSLEALARWDHPSRGMDDPRRFIPVAEDSDLIVDLDLAVIRQAFADLAGWQQTHPDLRLAVNLSARHLHHPGSTTLLLDSATAAGVRPESISLELTEATQIDVQNVNIPRRVAQLRGFGFQVWLDDFGTGWSSLEQLLWLAVDGIKIDRAVAVALGTPVGDALTSAVTGLATALGLCTTIEGIETPLQAEIARERGCDNGQGYVWSRAVSASDVPGLLAGVSLAATVTD